MQAMLTQSTAMKADYQRRLAELERHQSISMLQRAHIEAEADKQKELACVF